MGMTPLEGLMMGTRCGNVDPSIVFFMVDQLGYSLEQVKDVLNKQSGLLGISGKTSDFRGITQGLEEGDADAKLAFDMFCYRLAKFIASYYVPLGRVDALVFTGGIGENSLPMRSRVLELLAAFGFKEDPRITSYNVCYTKLLRTPLRPWRGCPLPARVPRRPAVAARWRPSRPG